MASPKKRLGRGLGGLINQGASQSNPISSVKTASRLEQLRVDNPDVSSGSEILGGFSEISIREITENPYQPRKTIDPEALQGLADSISEEGLLQPIVVRKLDEGYELIAGERRLRAFKTLHLDKIPARIINATDASSASLALIENLQREGLNPIEEALGYASLIRDFDLTQERASERLGKNRASVANSLRLLRLDTEVQGYLAKGHISTGHAKVILSIENPDAQNAFARQIIESGWSVREAEKRAKGLRESPSPSATSKSKSAGSAEDTAIDDLQKRVSRQLSAQVTLKHGKNKGQLIVEYHGLEDLQRILDQIGIKSL